MANLVRIEPTRSPLTGEPDGNAWFVYDDGRQCYRPIEPPKPPAAQSDFPCPMLIRDGFDKPIKSMADGKYYESRSALYRTYQPDGNPQGVRYEVTGNEDTTKFERPKRDKEKSMAAIKRALGDL